MKKKKIILIIILSIITLGLTGLLVYRNMDKEEVIVQSNDRDETLEQFKVTNEYINIRKENNTESDILGKVYKDEIYTVLEKQEDEYYVWYLIETNTEIKGYVAVQYEEESYVELLEVKEETEEETENTEE